MRQSWEDLPGIAIWPWPAAAELSIRIEPDPPPGSMGTGDPAVDAEWDRLCGANPRYFDGPILSVIGLVPGREIRVRRESYKRLAVQPAVHTGVEQLSVTGIVRWRDGRGTDRVLLGRRGRETRIYGGMWELGPSGGVDPCSRTSVCEGDLMEQLRFEFAEETGLRQQPVIERAVAVCHDLAARSYDVVFTCDVRTVEPTRTPSPEAWEYDGMVWLDVETLAAFDRGNAADIIPPTRALFRFFGWV